MASATLQETTPPASAQPGQRWFIVTDVDAWSGPFEGDRNFVVHGDGYASFEWRSRADDALALAKAVVAGEMTVDDARDDADLGEYIRDVEEAFEDEADVDLDEVVLDVCRDIVDGSRDVFEPDVIYDFENDVHIRDAARALRRMPPWARIINIDAGGPGSGYSQPVLVLDAGYTLVDVKNNLTDAPHRSGSGAQS